MRRSSRTRLQQGMAGGHPLSRDRGFGRCFLVAALVLPDRAIAEVTSETESRLTWQKVPGCIEEDELVAHVDAGVRSELVPPGRRLRGQVQGDRGEFVVTFTVVEEGRIVGRRVLELRVPECSDATESIELVATMLLEGGLSEEERRAHEEAERTTEDERELAAPEPVPDPAPIESEEVNQRSSQLELRGTIALSLTGELSPQIAPGGFVEFGFRGRFPLWGFLQAGWSARTWTPPSTSGASLGVSVASVAAIVCGGPTWNGVEWLACSGLAHVVHDRQTQGIAVPADTGWNQSSVLLQARATGVITGPFGWTLGLRLDLPFERVRYSAEGPTGSEELFLSGSVYPCAFAGISFTF